MRISSQALVCSPLTKRELDARPEGLFRFRVKLKALGSGFLLPYHVSYKPLEPRQGEQRQPNKAYLGPK